MTAILWLLLIFILLILAIGLSLSFYFTRRGQLGETHSPDEYGLQYESVEFKATDRVILRGVWVPAFAGTAEKGSSGRLRSPRTRPPQ